MDARDENGHYCGQRVDNGKFQCSPPDKMGYCGPSCGHCVGHPVYAVQDGVYCCAADWDYERSERQALLPWPTGKIMLASRKHNSEGIDLVAMPTTAESGGTAAVTFQRAATRRITEDDIRRIIREELVAICDKVQRLLTNDE